MALSLHQRILALFLFPLKLPQEILEMSWLRQSVSLREWRQQVSTGGAKCTWLFEPVWEAFVPSREAQGARKDAGHQGGLVLD